MDNQNRKHLSLSCLCINFLCHILICQWLQAISPITFMYFVELLLLLLEELQFYFVINFHCTVFLFYYAMFASPEGQDVN